jgi:ATP-binding cassette subfamily B protein
MIHLIPDHIHSDNTRFYISVVFQDDAPYQLTARQNIWLGNIDHSPDHEQIITAAQLSGADSVIRSMPQGYETIDGLFEKQAQHYR